MKAPSQWNSRPRGRLDCLSVCMRHVYDKAYLFSDNTVTPDKWLAEHRTLIESTADNQVARSHSPSPTPSQRSPAEALAALLPDYSPLEPVCCPL